MPVDSRAQRTIRRALAVIAVLFVISWANALTFAYSGGCIQENRGSDEGSPAKAREAASETSSKTPHSDRAAASDTNRSSNKDSKESASKAGPNPTTTVGANTEDRIGALEQKLSQMQKIIEQQQRTIELMAGAPGVKPVAVTNSETTTAPASASSTEKPTRPGSQKPEQSVGDRLQKVEERMTKIGPLRLSGDFRLRFDATLRKATEPPDPALTHLQNVRMRYRLRLNMDADVTSALSFHGQLATGPINNPLTLDQDFTSTVAHSPFFINQAWIDFHPNKNVQFQGGRVQEVFEDNSRFLFDSDLSFNGFNEKFTLRLNHSADKPATIELRAGQYWFSNPNVAIIIAGSPLALAGADIGTIGRSANLFHQGILVNQQFSKNWNQQFGGDVQVFREPNQIQLASTAAGVVLIVQPGLGLTLSGPMTGTGNATTTPGGAIYTAENFHIGRVTYRLNNSGFKIGDHPYPITFNVQLARNFGTDQPQRDAMLAALQIGRPVKRGDMSFLYVFSIKGANSLISQLTDDDLGTASGVNIRTHHVRWELGLSRNVTLQSLFFLQRELSNSGQFPSFFVPLNAFTPRQYRFQEQIAFSF